MWSVSKLLLLLVILTLASSSYLEFQLVRTPSQGPRGDLSPIACRDESAINQDADYKEVCYEKDISYNIPFIRDKEHVAFSADLTAPLSWVKGPDCVIEGTTQKCTNLQNSVIAKLKKKLKKRKDAT